MKIRDEVYNKNVNNNQPYFEKQGSTTGLANFIAFRLFRYLKGINPSLI